MRGVTSTAVFLVALCAAGLAHAAEPKAWRVGDSYVVQADVAVASPQGVAELLAGIERSAKRLCRSSGVRRDRRACESAAVQSAVAALDVETARAVRTVLASRAQRTFAERR